MELTQVVEHFINLYDYVPSDLISALVGALIGGWFTRNATLKAHRLERETKQIEDDQEIKNVLSMLKAELETAWDIYNSEYVVSLRATAQGQPHFYTFPIGETPFAIYDSTRSKLAVAPPGLARKIIRAYIRMKALVEMIKLNNRNFEIANGIARAEWRKEYDSQAVSMIDEFVPSKTLQGIYDVELVRAAEQMGMGQRADGIRELTAEAEAFIKDISAEIDSFLSGKLVASKPTTTISRSPTVFR